MSELQWWEVLAVVLAVAYLLLAIRQNIWCWAAAAVSTSLYLYIMYEARLYMESALQLFYLAMAAYGWWQWRSGGEGGAELRVSTWPLCRIRYSRRRNSRGLRSISWPARLTCRVRRFISRSATWSLVSTAAVSLRRTRASSRAASSEKANGFTR